MERSFSIRHCYYSRINSFISRTNSNQSQNKAWTKHILTSSIYKFKKVTLCVRSFLRFFVCLFVCYPSFSSLWPAFTLTVYINALYNESVHGREEQATWINLIPLKLATLLTLQTLNWDYTFGTDVLIVSATSRHHSVLRWRAGRFAHDHFSTECRSKRQFGSLICYSWLHL